MERQHLLENARKEYEQLRSGLQESLKSEHANLGHDLKSRAQREVFEIVRRVLSDLAGTKLEAQIAHVFVQKLQSIDPEEKARLLSALHANGRPVMVRSAFDLDERAQTELENSVKNLLGEGIQVQFGRAPEEVGGIELSANGFKINWTIADYLDSLEKRISELQLVQQNKPLELQSTINAS
jgi:F-type H+-transporting ATPase subunit b